MFHMNWTPLDNLFLDLKIVDSTISSLFGNFPIFQYSLNVYSNDASKGH